MEQGRRPVDQGSPAGEEQSAIGGAPRLPHSTPVTTLHRSSSTSWRGAAMPEFTQRFSLTGKTTLVTGASKGIGKEICRVLADAGADIAAVARDRDGLAEVRRTIEAMGRRCLVIEADLATVEGPQKAARTALQAWGAIDILVNN